MMVVEWMGAWAMVVGPSKKGSIMEISGVALGAPFQVLHLTQQAIQTPSKQFNPLISTREVFAPPSLFIT